MSLRRKRKSATSQEAASSSMRMWHLMVTDLSAQHKHALFAPTVKYCPLCSPKTSSFFSLWAGLPLHAADQPPAAQSDTQPRWGHHLFSSVVEIMDNFLWNRKLVFQQHKQYNNKYVKSDSQSYLIYTFTSCTNCKAFNVQICRHHRVRIWVSGLKSDKTSWPHVTFHTSFHFISYFISY